MKFAVKVLLMMSVVTLSMVVYVHGQIAIFRVSYEIDHKAKLIEVKQDEFRRVKFDVDQLKAPNLLEEKMQKLQLDLTLPEKIRVVKLPQALVLPDKVVSGMAQDAGRTGHFQFLGQIIKVAQAKVDP